MIDIGARGNELSSWKIPDQYLKKQNSDNFDFKKGKRIAKLRLFLQTLKTAQKRFQMHRWRP